MIRDMKTKAICEIFLLVALFALSAHGAIDPLAGIPEGERIVLWPEGKVPKAESHQYAPPFIEWLTPSNKTTDAVMVLTCGEGYDIYNWSPGGKMAALSSQTRSYESKRNSIRIILILS